ncbi:hypothetical protein JY651_39535 [Pyxidicoccus parkwayensis]|uniref:Lipoprotein n=1 Tax=Pyxidicoccus parkwayensis TaxID=2813578 RepID=A0ABX7NR22_9BACT|nr:hypothetical protein [Pyxidicoccus parkwaysis]QSQ21230.1 hypothetical protein JY651_39535 [Pyxidicoccus parkwaysis]
MGLGLGLVLACRPRKQDECARVQAHVLEETRVMDGFHDHVHDAQFVVQHARRLREVSAGLRALDIQDADLRDAVVRYHTSLDRLAEAWIQAAEQHAERLADGGADAGPGNDGTVTLTVLMSTHAAALNGARSAVSDVCGDR